MTFRCHLTLKYDIIVDGLTRFFWLDFEDNYVKSNADTAILSATKMFPGTLVYDSIRFIRIRGTVLVRGGVNY